VSHVRVISLSDGTFQVRQVPKERRDVQVALGQRDGRASPVCLGRLDFQDQEVLQDRREEWVQAELLDLQASQVCIVKILCPYDVVICEINSLSSDEFS